MHLILYAGMQCVCCLDHKTRLRFNFAKQASPVCHHTKDKKMASCRDKPLSVIMAHPKLIKHGMPSAWSLEQVVPDDGSC